MKLVENRLIIWALIILSVGSSFGVYWIHELSIQPQKNYGHYPDSIGYYITLNRYNEQGELSTITTADKAMHYPDTKTTVFQTLTLHAFGGKGQSPAVITAPSSIAYNKGEKVDVLGKVVMVQAGDATHPAAKVVTTNVTIYPNQKYLETKSPVHAEQPGVQVDAVGARYDYAQEKLDLLSQTHVIYQPTEAKKTQ